MLRVVQCSVVVGRSYLLAKNDIVITLANVLVIVGEPNVSSLPVRRVTFEVRPQEYLAGLRVQVVLFLLLWRREEKKEGKLAIERGN